MPVAQRDSAQRLLFATMYVVHPKCHTRCVAITSVRTTAISFHQQTKPVDSRCPLPKQWAFTGNGEPDESTLHTAFGVGPVVQGLSAWEFPS